MTSVILALIATFQSSVNVASMELLSSQGNRFLSAIGSWTLAFGHMRYGRPSLAIAGLFVLIATALSSLSNNAVVFTPVMGKCEF